LALWIDAMADTSRAAAWSLLCEYTKTLALRRHALGVEASMRALARQAGVTGDEEVERWGLVGLLHDFDYERFPTEQDHVWRGMEILRERGWPDELIQAIGAHALYTGIARDTPMKKAILAADELTGFVSAAALIRPTRRVADLPPESVLKRMKDKAFARAVDRSIMKLGAEEVGLPMLELAALVIAAQLPIAPLLGLDGGPGLELPDASVPAPAP
jgi:putative nucleotidyltransferase with HDIG domain